MCIETCYYVFFKIYQYFYVNGTFEVLKVLKVISIDLYFKSALQKHIEKLQMYKTDCLKCLSSLQNNFVK